MKIHSIVWFVGLVIVLTILVNANVFNGSINVPGVGCVSAGHGGLTLHGTSNGACRK